jgi:hypothetical protein
MFRTSNLTLVSPNEIVFKTIMHLKQPPIYVLQTLHAFDSKCDIDKAYCLQFTKNIK